MICSPNCLRSHAPGRVLRANRGDQMSFIVESIGVRRLPRGVWLTGTLVLAAALAMTIGCTGNSTETREVAKDEAAGKAESADTAAAGKGMADVNMSPTSVPDSAAAAGTQV